MRRYDFIELRDIRAYGRHGANPHERDHPQPFDLDVRLEVDLSAARATDELAQTIDYAELHARIVHVVRSESFELLERLGDVILTDVMRDERIVSAELSIAKPHLLAGATPVVTLRSVRVPASAQESHDGPALAAIGIGSNLGDSAATVERAIASLATLGRVAARSSLYRSAAWGETAQPDFINAAALLATPLAPRALLGALKGLERDLGRVESYRWGPRAIDLDILTYGDLALDEPDLTVPHARLFERAFALAPLAEIAPAFGAAYAALPAADRASVQRIRP